MNLDKVLLTEEGTEAGNLISYLWWYLNCIWYWEVSTLHIVSFLPVSVETGVSCLLFSLPSALWCFVWMIWPFWPNMIAHGFFLFLVSTCTSSSFLLPLLAFWFCVCVCGVLVSDAFCFWLGRLPLVFSVVNNEFIFIYDLSAILEASGFLSRIMVEILLSVNEYRDCIRVECCWIFED